MTAVQLGLFAPQTPPDELLCWLWLAHILGPASAHAGRVMDWCGGSAQSAWQERESKAFRAAAGPAAARRALQPGCEPETYRPLARRCADLGVRVVPYDHPDYPLALTRIPDMPLVLYCTGDPAWLNAPARVGMVGSRRPDSYGRWAASAVGRGLAEAGAVIVSGLADGLDSECHRAAVEADAPTIGVQGVAIDRTYPAANRLLREKIEAHGCVVGEYPPGFDPGRHGFLQRNRLIAGLGQALVVVQATERSGTMSTVGHAERYGRTVYALPGDVGRDASAGTNRLIQTGRARLLQTASDLLEDLGLNAAAAAPAAAPAPPLSEGERKALTALGREAKSVEELAAACGMTAAALAPVLMRLELAGRAKALPGQRYILL